VASLRQRQREKPERKPIYGMIAIAHPVFAHTGAVDRHLSTKQGD
jgi:hypothetical protein